MVKAETKHSKINGGLKNVFSIKVAVKPRDYKYVLMTEEVVRGHLERAE